MGQLLHTCHAQLARTKPLQRRVEGSISVKGLRRRKTVKGSVWGISLVKNEADIIAHTVRHFLQQDLDGLIVVDNGSTDGTVELLRELAESDQRVLTGEDKEPAHHQGRKTSYLAHLAWRAGADWVVPFDADEQWFAHGGTVPEFLRASEAEVVNCAVYDVYPAPTTLTESVLDLSATGPLHMDSAPTGWVKVAFRARPWVWVGEGNHGVDSKGPRATGLSLLHFQYRSLEHVSRKVRGGRDAVAKAFGDVANHGSHWQDLSRLSRDELEARWVAHLAGDTTIEGLPPRARTVVTGLEKWRSWDPNSELTAAPESR